MQQFAINALWALLGVTSNCITILVVLITAAWIIQIVSAAGKTVKETDHAKHIPPKV